MKRGTSVIINGDDDLVSNFGQLVGSYIQADFDSTIKDNKMVVVDFFATWCGPCRVIAPKIEEMEKEYSDVVFIKVDVDENEETAAACEISAMPTFHIYKDGVKVGEVVGANEKAIREEIQKNQ